MPYSLAKIVYMAECVDELCVVAFSDLLAAKFAVLLISDKADALGSERRDYLSSTIYGTP